MPSLWLEVLYAQFFGDPNPFEEADSNLKATRQLQDQLDAVTVRSGWFVSATTSFKTHFLINAARKGIDGANVVSLTGLLKCMGVGRVRQSSFPPSPL